MMTNNFCIELSAWLLLAPVVSAFVCSPLVSHPPVVTPIQCDFTLPLLFHRHQHPSSPLTKCTITRLSLLGELFGKGDSKNNSNDNYNNNNNNNESKLDRVLQTFTIHVKKAGNAERDADADITFQAASLSDFLVQKWANLFVTGQIKLTTPVQVVPIDSSTVQLLFRETKTGYKSKQEEEESNHDTMNHDQNKKKEEMKPISQGGVQVQVISPDTVTGGPELLCVVAKRCNMEKDTTVKEMSEETIVKELQKALDVWKFQSGSAATIS